MKPFIIGITGGSGSGKTTFIEHLVSKCKPMDICFISQDHYYKPKSEIQLDHNGITNYDTPNSIDIDLFIRDIDRLINGEEVQKMEYDFNNPDFKPQMLTFTPSPVLVLEGIFLFEYAELAPKIDFRIFIETREHLRIKRRLMRDLAERGYPIEETLYYLENHVAPGYEKYVQPHKYTSDIVVPNNTDFSKVTDMLAAFLKSRI